MPSRGLGGRARRRRACRRRRDAAVARDWAGGLGTDALLAIFRRLDHVDVLLAADNVCRSWRRAAREEPTLWRRITMRGHEGIARRLNRGGMACEAVRRAAGQCEAFCGEYAGDDGFLMYLIEQAPCLKSLRLISCNYVSNEGFTEPVKKLPLLEDLEVSLCDNVGGYYACGSDRRSDVFEVVGEVCPKLKHFRRSNKLFDVRVWWNKDDDVQGIATMHGLRSLQLFGHALTNEGLETILDGCPHLECLDIRHCFNIDMDEALHLKCAGIKTLRLPDDPTDDYDLEVHSPIRMVVEEEIVWDSGYYSDDSGDDDWDFYGEPSRYESDLDKYEKMLPLNMRTFLK
ncbi:hypothetical protein SETIT_6G033200v2 [Setaria italica]|uniref:F-box domain-containing protein n=1 Tax=Setaria italica TaxID=4555 RepID=K3YLT5_SETIT|nr:hypothetical protein SETIT_6G033200v2 [Setaria italica]